MKKLSFKKKKKQAKKAQKAILKNKKLMDLFSVAIMQRDIKKKKLKKIMKRIMKALVDRRSTTFEEDPDAFFTNVARRDELLYREAKKKEAKEK